MELLPPTSFASSVASSKDSINRISLIVAKYLGQAKADGFLSACSALDFSTANAVLDETVKELTGYDSVFWALGAFADKFPQLSPELGGRVSAALSESDKVKAIESYRTQILGILSGSV